MFKHYKYTYGTYPTNDGIAYIQNLKKS